MVLVGSHCDDNSTWMPRKVTIKYLSLWENEKESCQLPPKTLPSPGQIDRKFMAISWKVMVTRKYSTFNFDVFTVTYCTSTFFCWILWGNVRFMFSHGILYPEWDIPGSGWQWACRITAFKIQKLDRRIQEMCHVLPPPRMENSGKSRFVEICKPKMKIKSWGWLASLGVG